MIKVLGHRGARVYEPENTLRSFKKAIELGVDQIELDLHFSRDGQLMVIHDDKLNRTTNGEGFIKDFTLDELKKLDAGKGKKIPSLQEVIDLVRDTGIFLQIELKELNMGKPVLEVIQKNDFEEKVMVISFLHKELISLKELNSKIKTGILIDRESIDPLKRLRQTKADAVSMRYTLVNKKLVEQLHQNDIELTVWVVNELKNVKRMIKLGVDIIGTDRPDLVIFELKRLHLK
jgi:glycerophosphoryl diester phosphodiesterase